ncbi:MAG: GNAT family N-acetyltransferase [Kineosporiaceae bacterium]
MGSPTRGVRGSATMGAMRIERDDLTGDDVARFLAEHLAQMHAQSPPDSVHALGLEELRRREVTFWTVRDDDGVLVGCGALKELDPAHAEVKSMRTDPARRRQGIASLLLRHLIDEARSRGYRRLSLETGSAEHFAAARALYTAHGFAPCPPFADYTDDPLSTYLTLAL